MLLFDRLSHPAIIESPLINFVVVLIISRVEDGYNPVFTEINAWRLACGLSGEANVATGGKAEYKTLFVHIIDEKILFEKTANRLRNRLVHRLNLDIKLLP